MQRKRKSNWKQRRVAFLISDRHRKIMPVSVFMPVRTREHTSTGPIFEGPINAMWQVVESRLTALDLKDVDLVGVLVASDEMLDIGRINWLEQSGPEGVAEAGAAFIQNVIPHEPAA